MASHCLPAHLGARFSTGLRTLLNVLAASNRPSQRVTLGHHSADRGRAATTDHERRRPFLRGRSPGTGHAESPHEDIGIFGNATDRDDEAAQEFERNVAVDSSDRGAGTTPERQSPRKFTGTKAILRARTGNAVRTGSSRTHPFTATGASSRGEDAPSAALIPPLSPVSSLAVVGGSPGGPSSRGTVWFRMTLETQRSLASNRLLRGRRPRGGAVAGSVGLRPG